MNLKDLNWALFLNKYKLVYVPIPKVACTKIRTLLILLNRGYEDVELLEFLKNTPAPFYHWEFGISDNHHVTFIELSNILNNPNYLKFAFVRNPYKRIESIYYYRINNPDYNINLYPKKYSIYLQKYAVNFVNKIKADLIWEAPYFIKYFFTKMEEQMKQFFFRELGYSILVRGTKKFTLQKSETYNYELISKTMQDNFQKVYGKEFENNIFEYLYIKVKNFLGYPNFQDINLQESPISFAEFVNYIFNPHSALHIVLQEVTRGYLFN